MATKRALWTKAGRFLSGLVIACFFLPFFGVSCQGMDVVTLSGTQLAGGCKPGGMLAEAADKADEAAGRAGVDAPERGDVKIDKVDMEPLAIVALALALVVFALSWVKSRGALVGAFVVSIACIGALVVLHVKISGDLSEAIDKEVKKKPGGEEAAKMSREIIKEGDVTAGSRFGLWGAWLLLAGCAALTGMALREKDPPV